MDISNKKLFKQQCFINGEWVDSQDNKSIDVNNPATQEIIGKVPNCGKKETSIAIKAAENSWKEWRSKTAKERSNILKKWFKLIEENHEDLAKIMTVEQGKPIAEARGEITYGASFVEWFAEEGKRVYGDTIPDVLPDRRIVIIKQPVGVVAAITPWNFPSSMITRKCAPALAVGSSQLLQTPLCRPFFRNRYLCPQAFR